ncbi:arylamine N-acetyltransferase [Pyxidicoccus sp. 3LFB2]
MTLPRLDSATVRAYLARLGNPEVSLDLEGVSRLARAHLHGLPIHNLTLFHARHLPGSPPVEAMVEANIAGWGGACHELTPSFVALLRTLGFEAWLAAAKTQGSGVLPMGIVRLLEGLFVVDVGSGNPCLHPLPLDRGPLDFTAYGQRFRFEQESAEQYRLVRTLPDGQAVEVYRLSPEPRPADSLIPLVLEHQALARLSLGTVRAVRMTGWALAILQDGLYQRFAAGLTGTRRVNDWDALVALLRTQFGVPEEVLQRCVPPSSERGPHAPREVGRSDEPLRFILSLAGTERAESVAELFASVHELLERGQRPSDSIGVLVVENGRHEQSDGPLAEALQRARERGLRVAHVNARNVLWRLAPFQHRGLLPEPCSAPLPIGASRMLQVSLLWDHLRTGSLGLPHPGDGGGPLLVWMLDDDLAFRRLREGPTGLEVGPGDDLFARAEELWATHPQVSVVLGTFTGAPPIPGYATFRVQLHDLLGNLGGMFDSIPEQPWTPGDAPRALPDYYYDHARGATTHLDAVFPWKPAGPPPWSVRDAFRTLCTAFARVPHGHQVTRSLTQVGSSGLAQSRNRGGNALFFDLDALMVAPYPVLRGLDGIDTRRADTLWAHLAAREPLFHMVQADFDLFHGRRVGDGSSPLAEPQPEAAALRRFVQAQERGVVLARLLEKGTSTETAGAEREIANRREVLARSREGLCLELLAVRSVLEHPEAWWWRDEADASCARSCLVAVKHVESLARAVDALDEPWLPARLAEFARHVVAALPDWRDVWG